MSVDNLVVDGLPVCQLGQQFGCWPLSGFARVPNRPLKVNNLVFDPYLGCQGANLALKGQQFGCRPLSGLPTCQTNSYTGNKADNPATKPTTRLDTRQPGWILDLKIYSVSCFCFFTVFTLGSLSWTLHFMVKLWT